MNWKENMPFPVPERSPWTIARKKRSLEIGPEEGCPRSTQPTQSNVRFTGPGASAA